MKRLTLLIPFLAILFLLPACNNDNEPDEPEAWEATARIKFEIHLSTHNRSIESTINNEVVRRLDYEMSTIASLIYVIHDAESGSFIKYYNLSQNDIEPYTREGITILEDHLPFGRYYISMIVTTDDKLDSSLLKGVSQSYSKAACQIPNNHIFYKTFEVDCSLPEGVEKEYLQEDLEFSEEVLLHLITGELVFLLPAGSKDIPLGANFNMVIEVSDLPSAFYLKNGKTLNNKEAKEMNLYTFNHQFEITKIFESQIVATYFMLANHELENHKEERGYFQFTYKEDAASDTITRYIAFEFPESETDPLIPISTFSYFYMNELYPEDAGNDPVIPEKRVIELL